MHRSSVENNSGVCYRFCSSTEGYLKIEVHPCSSLKKQGCLDQLNDFDNVRYQSLCDRRVRRQTIFARITGLAFEKIFQYQVPTSTAHEKIKTLARALRVFATHTQLVYGVVKPVKLSYDVVLE